MIYATLAIVATPRRRRRLTGCRLMSSRAAVRVRQMQNACAVRVGMKDDA